MAYTKDAFYGGVAEKAFTYVARFSHYYITEVKCTARQRWLDLILVRYMVLLVVYFIACLFADVYLHYNLYMPGLAGESPTTKKRMRIFQKLEPVKDTDSCLLD